jgi:hypothetical protein
LPHKAASIVAIVFDPRPDRVHDLRSVEPRWKLRNLVLISVLAVALFIAVVYAAVEMVS